MTSPAVVHSMPLSLGTNVGYSLHKKATLLLGQKPSNCQCWNPALPWWAPHCDCPINWWQSFWKHRMLVPLW